MGIADWLPFFGGRRWMAESLDLMTREAVDFADAEWLGERRLALWATLCEASSQTLRQLFVHNDDPLMDWGLKRRASRVTDVQMATLFWWMMLYQLVLFKNRGLDGFEPEDEIDFMSHEARHLVEREFRKFGSAAEPPAEWSDKWRAQFALESALDMYDHFYALLGLRRDLTKRIEHVSHFTTITERAWDRMAASKASRARGQT